MAATLRRSHNKRSNRYLNPEDPDFDPLPAVACLLALDVAKLLFTDDMESLLIAAKKQVLTLLQTMGQFTADVISDESVSATSTPSTSDTYNLPPLKKFKFLSERLSTSQLHSSLDSKSSIKMQLGRYLAECRLLQCDQDNLEILDSKRAGTYNTHVL